jgi:hypothetical protein
MAQSTLDGVQLKKQSQFVDGQVNVNIVGTRNYEDMLRSQGRKNKPNLSPWDQSQSHDAAADV